MARKVIIFGGNGFVGGAVARHALDKGLKVVCACRSGPPRALPAGQAEWVGKVEWAQADAVERSQVMDLVDLHSDAAAVVSTVGVLTMNHDRATRINGDANVNIAAAVYKSPSVGKFVLVSAAPMWPVHCVLKGYYDGKDRAEAAVRQGLGDRASVLRPGMVYGTRYTAAGTAIPLSLVGGPLEAVLRPLHGATGIGLLTPAVSVDVVAKAALQGALDGSPTVDQFLDAAAEASEAASKPGARRPVVGAMGAPKMAPRFYDYQGIQAQAALFDARPTEAADAAPSSP